MRLCDQYKGLVSWMSKSLKFDEIRLLSAAGFRGRHDLYRGEVARRPDAPARLPRCLMLPPIANANASLDVRKSTRLNISNSTGLALFKNDEHVPGHHGENGRDIHGMAPQHKIQMSTR